MDRKSFRLGTTNCLYCGVLVNASCNTEEDIDIPPKKGSLTICFTCEGILRFKDDELNLEKPSEAELVQLREEPAIKKALITLRKIKAERVKNLNVAVEEIFGKS